MKTTIVNFAIALAVSMVAGVSAVPTELVDSGAANPPPDGTVVCATSGKSPGITNIAIAAAELRPKGMCGTDGGTTQMVHRDGIRVYAMGEPGSAPCSHVANKLMEIVQHCQAFVNGDVRAGGEVSINGLTYIQVSM